MTCSACGADLEHHGLYCRGCLRVMLAVDDPLALRGDEHLFVLLEACEQLLAGLCDVEAFREFLSDFEVAMHQREGEIRALEIPSYLEDDFAEEQEVGLSGVDRCNLGLQRLADVDGSERHAVEAALVLFHDGVSRVTEAMQINRRNRDRPLWA